MSWLFSQALVEEYSAGTSLAGQPLSQLNVMPTPHKFWQHDKTIEPFDHSRFGLTSQVLTATHGAELLTSYLAASRAKTLAAQGKGQASLPLGVACGQKCGASLARYDHNSCGWKTATYSPSEESTEFSGIWPKWGSMSNGASYLRKIPALPTNGKESGSWPTPTAITNSGGAAMCKWGGSGSREKLRKMVTPAELNGPLNPEWVEWLMGWPIGWTDLKPLATAKFREWQQQHGGF